MLGNNADAFFTTPMRHRVTQGGNVANQNAMPAPRDLNQSATGVVTTRLTGDFLPGLGEADTVLADELPAVADPQPYSFPGRMIAAAGTPVGLAVIAGLLFFTPPGKALRRRIFG